MPKHRSQIGHDLPFLAKFQQRVLSRLRIRQFDYPGVNLLAIHRRLQRGWTLLRTHFRHRTFGAKLSRRDRYRCDRSIPSFPYLRLSRPFSSRDPNETRTMCRRSTGFVANSKQTLRLGETNLHDTIGQKLPSSEFYRATRPLFLESITRHTDGKHVRLLGNEQIFSSRDIRLL